MAAGASINSPSCGPGRIFCGYVLILSSDYFVPRKAVRALTDFKAFQLPYMVHTNHGMFMSDQEQPFVRTMTCH